MTDRPFDREMAKYCDVLATRLRAALGRNAVGLYVYGSLTQDAYEARRSDIDCVALLHRRLSDRQFRSLRSQLRALGKQDARTRRLQMTLLVRGELFRMNGAGWVFQFSRLRDTGSDGNPIIWANIRDSGHVVFGPRPASFLPPLTTPLIEAALARELGYLREELVSLPSSRWRRRQSYRRYAVATICRVLYTHRTGRVVSKPRAVAWALQRVPLVHRVIVRLAAQSGSRPRKPYLPLPGIRELLEYATAQL